MAHLRFRGHLLSERGRGIHRPEALGTWGDPGDPPGVGTDLLEVPTIYKAYVRAMVQGIYPKNMALHGTVPSF